LKLRPAEEVLRESEAFFMKEGRVHTTLRRLKENLDREGIPHAII
jgi:hypothetical protein